MALYQRALSTPSPGGADTRVDSLRRTLQVSDMGTNKDVCSFKMCETSEPCETSKLTGTSETSKLNETSEPSFNNENSDSSNSAKKSFYLSKQIVKEMCRTLH